MRSILKITLFQSTAKSAGAIPSSASFPPLFMRAIIWRMAGAGYGAARAMGSDILSVRQIRKLGTKAVLARVPKDAALYITIDIDAFCPSIAPGTGTPSHGGFLYYEVLELLQGLSRAHRIVGIDLVEVAPDYDLSGSTQILAAQILLNFIGFIFHERGRAEAVSR